MLPVSEQNKFEQNKVLRSFGTEQIWTEQSLAKFRNRTKSCEVA